MLSANQAQQLTLAERRERNRSFVPRDFRTSSFSRLP